MMSIAIGLTRSWVRFYTLGLPPELREARRAEIESDLWEQGEDADANGSQPDDTALQVFVRLLLGVPSDLTWRLEARSRRGSHETTSPSARRSASASAADRSFLGIALLVAAFWVLAGALNAFGSGENTAREDYGRFLAGMMFFVPASMIVAGLWLQRRSLLLGSVLVLVGVVPMAIAMYWTMVVPIAAVVLVVLAAARAIRIARERDRVASASGGPQ